MCRLFRSREDQMHSISLARPLLCPMGHGKSLQSQKGRNNLNMMHVKA